MKQQNSETLGSGKRKRKFLLLLPLIDHCHTALGFYALGGGKGQLSGTGNCSKRDQYQFTVGTV